MALKVLFSSNENSWLCASLKPLYSVRAEHAFPPTHAVYTRQLIRGSRVASLLCLAALARLGNVKMLAAFGGLPRFARWGLASLGLA